MYRRLMALALVAALALTAMVAAYAAAPSGNTVKYNSSTGKIEGLAVGMSYSSDGGTSWTDVTAAVAASGITVTPPATYWVSFTATAEAERGNAGNYLEIKVGAAPSAPDLTNVKYEDGRIVGLNTLWEYNTSSSTATKWTSVPASGTVAVSAKDTVQKFWFRVKATSSAAASAASEFTVPANSKSDISGISIDFENEVFTGFTGSWKITTQGPSYTGEYLYDLTATFTSWPQTTYYLRKAGDTVGAAFTTPPRPAAPKGFTYNVKEQRIEGVTDKMRWRDMSDSGDGFYGQWQDVTGTFTSFPQEAGKTKTIHISYKATENAYASFNYVGKIWPASSVDPVFNGLRFQNGAIYGVTSAMEYQVAGQGVTAVDPEAEWSQCPDGKLVVERMSYDQTVFIRLIDNPALADSVIVPKFIPPPDLKLDLVNSIVYGFEPDTEYIYKASRWGDITEDMLKTVTVPDAGDPNNPDKATDVLAMDISFLLKGKALTLQFAVKPDDGTVMEESITKIAIEAGPAKETVSIKGYEPDEGGGIDRAVVSGKAGLQYRLETDSNWSTPTSAATDIILPVGYTASLYMFRVAPTATKQASPATKLKIPAMPKAPKVKVDYKKEIITVKGGQEFSYDGVEWQKVSKGTKELLKLSELYGSSVYIRTSATAKKPSSLPTKADVYPRLPMTPDTEDVKVIMSGSRKKVVMRSGGRQIEYLDAKGKWKKGVPKYSDSLNTMVRFMAVGEFGPSEAVPFNSQGVAESR